MKKLLMAGLVGILFLFVAFPVFAADNCETITVANTAIGFTASKITKPNFEAKEAICVNQGAQIRFWTDGTSPTSTVGIILEVGQGFVLDKRGDVIRFKAIRTGDTSGVLSCCYN